MNSWFENPQQLFSTDKVFDFWPNSNQSVNDRVDAATRFIIYATCIIYLIRRDARIFVLGGMVIGVLYVMYKAGMIKDTHARPTLRPASSCQLPTKDNPMANLLMTDDPSRNAACFSETVQPMIKAHVDDMFDYDSGRSRSPLPQYQKNASSRQFVSMPVSSQNGDEQNDFAEWCYGPKFKPMCKSDGSVCNPDARGVQPEAFGGLSASGKRSGMF